MTLIRMYIVLGSGNDLAMAATIATRYSAVRRQTANSKGFVISLYVFMENITMIIAYVDVAAASSHHYAMHYMCTCSNSMHFMCTCRLVQFTSCTSAMHYMCTCSSSMH